MAEFINESGREDRNKEILACVANDVPIKDIAECFALHASTIHRIIAAEKRAQVFDLKLVDGTQTVPVGKVRTAKGFIHACRVAIRKYSATFSRLELPQWKLSCGAESISLNAKELQ